MLNLYIAEKHEAEESKDTINDLNLYIKDPHATENKQDFPLAQLCDDLMTQSNMLKKINHDALEGLRSSVQSSSEDDAIFVTDMEMAKRDNNQSQGSIDGIIDNLMALSKSYQILTGGEGSPAVNI